MINLDHVVGGAITAVVMTVAAAFGGVFDSQPTQYTNVPPTSEPVAALPANAQCPGPPRTAGAVFKLYGAPMSVSPDGGKTLQTLSCDFGDYNYVLRADGTEELQKYKGVGSPHIETTREAIDAVLATLR